MQTHALFASHKQAYVSKSDRLEKNDVFFPQEDIRRQPDSTSGFAWSTVSSVIFVGRDIQPIFPPHWSISLKTLSQFTVMKTTLVALWGGRTLGCSNQVSLMTSDMLPRISYTAFRLCTVQVSAVVHSEWYEYLINTFWKHDGLCVLSKTWLDVEAKIEKWWISYWQYSAVQIECSL